MGTDKNRGGEHPMWLVTSHSPLLSNRRSPTGTGFIDKFFDIWLPSLVDMLRNLVRGPNPSAELHETVISKDIVSRPALAKKVPLVEAASPDDALFTVKCGKVNFQTDAIFQDTQVD